MPKWKNDLLQDAKDIDAYGRSLRAAVRGLWNGQLSLFDADDSFWRSIRRFFPEAWARGIAKVGLVMSELTGTERDALNDLIEEEQGYILHFLENVLNQNKAAGMPLQPHLDRVDMWLSRYNRVEALAYTLAAQDLKLKWVVGPTEHCTDCAKLEGRVYRASIWARYNIQPQSPLLECFGTRCQCSLEPTEDRVTPGRPPNLVGPKGKRKHVHHTHV